MDQCHVLADIKAATNIIVGEDDPACPVSAAEILHAGIAGSKFVTLKNAAHLPNIEKKDEFNKAMMDFLNAQSG